MYVLMISCLWWSVRSVYTASIKASEGQLFISDPQVGLHFTKEGPGYLAAGHWVQSLAISLKAPPYQALKFSCPPTNASFVLQVCSILQKQVSDCNEVISRVYQAAQKSASLSLPTQRSRRSLTDLIGSVGNFFGLASTKQVKLLSKALKMTNEQQEASSRAVKEMAKIFMTYQEATRAEMDQRDEVIRDSLQRVSLTLQGLQDQIGQSTSVLYDHIQANQLAILVVTQLVPILVQVRTTLQTTATQYSSFQDAVSECLQGKLSPKLVPPTNLKKVLRNIHETITSRHSNLDILANRLPQSSQYSSIQCSPVVLPDQDRLVLALMFKTIDLSPRIFEIWKVTSFGTPIERHVPASSPYLRLLDIRAHETQSMISLDLDYSYMAYSSSTNEVIRLNSPAIQVASRT